VAQNAKEIRNTKVLNTKFDYRFRFLLLSLITAGCLTFTNEENCVKERSLKTFWENKWQLRPNFRYHPRICLAVLKKTTQNLRTVLCPGQNLNQAFPEYKLGTTTCTKVLGILHYKSTEIHRYQ
jgi:hypothetical protein